MAEPAADGVKAVEMEVVMVFVDFTVVACIDELPPGKMVCAERVGSGARPEASEAVVDLVEGALVDLVEDVGATGFDTERLFVALATIGGSVTCFSSAVCS